jgi:citrate lyase beta subunit
MSGMFEPGMKMFRVRLTRDGEDAGTYLLPAFNVDDAVARAKDQAARSKAEGATDDNPFDNLEGLEAWVGPFR